MSIYHQPYTYLIGWSRLNKYYYGVRFAKGCEPSDLWVTYFTSSKDVKALREREGEPDVIQIRKTFDDKFDAINWEEKVLRRMNVLREEKWLNKNIAGAIPPHLAGMKNKGKSRSPEASAKAAATRKSKNIPPHNKGKKMPQISKALKGRSNPNKGKKIWSFDGRSQSENARIKKKILRGRRKRA